MEKLRKEVANELFDVFVYHIGVKEEGRYNFIMSYSIQNTPPQSYHLIGKVGPKTYFWYDGDSITPRNSIVSTWKTPKISKRVDKANFLVDKIFDEEKRKKQMPKQNKITTIDKIKDWFLVRFVEPWWWRSGD